ncbi:MAG: hypothetical protein DRP56_10440, partial [Planctomycetota bacterium]
AGQEKSDILTDEYSLNMDGFIVDWLVCGPFPNPGKWPNLANWDTDFLVTDGGEANIKPTSEMSYKSKLPDLNEKELTVKWNLVRVLPDYRDSYADIALEMMFRKTTGAPTLDKVIGYAFCYIESSADIDAKLKLGSDDGFKAWVNGNLVGSERVARGCETDQNIMPVKLKKGLNTLLLKIEDNVGGYKFIARFTDMNDQPLRTVKVRLPISVKQDKTFFTLQGAIYDTDKPFKADKKGVTKIGTVKTKKVEKPYYSGQRYTATVPDTLDLAYRAKLAIRSMGNMVDPNDEYMAWGDVLLGSNIPHMKHAAWDADCTPKYLDAMTQLRLACGTDEFIDAENGMEAMILSKLDKDDGLYYHLVTDPVRLWHYAAEYTNAGSTGMDIEDRAAVTGAAIALKALLTRNDLGFPHEKQIQALVRGIEEAAIKKDDYAYYPDGGKGVYPFTRPRSGWKNTDEPGLPGYKGVEMSLVHGKHRAYKALSLWADSSGDKQALDFAGRLARFVMKPHQWGNPSDPPSVASSELGHFKGVHFVMFSHALKDLLAYGLAAKDPYVLDFVRSSYEYFRSYGIHRMGYFAYHPTLYEAGCTHGDMTAVAIKMSRAGIGDYWDDVDRLIRNHLTESQIMDRDLLEQMVQTNPKKVLQHGHQGEICTDNVLDRVIGSFPVKMTATSIIPNRIIMCCTGNGSRGLAYAWDAIVDGQGDKAKVNLLLNRASKWVDVDSYLPYEGKVVIHNKIARQISVRIPIWVDRSKLQATVNGTKRNLSWFGAFLVFDDMKPNDTLQLDFPVTEETLRLTATEDGKKVTYTIMFRGNTVVDISPRDDSPGVYPVYLRDHMKAKKAPMKTIQRFVADKEVVRW